MVCANVPAGVCQGKEYILCYRGIYKIDITEDRDGNTYKFSVKKLSDKKGITLRGRHFLVDRNLALKFLEKEVI